MKHKRLFIIAGAVALVALLVIGLVHVYRSAHITNVFDEMYYSVVDPFYTDTSFGYVDAASNASEDIIPGSDELTGAYVVSYQSWKKRLLGNENMFMHFNPNDQRYVVYASVSYYEFDGVSLSFTYYPDTKTLEFDPVKMVMISTSNSEKSTEEFMAEFDISQSDIRDYQEYFLYEVLLKDWVDGNGERSRFSEGDYGEFTIIDRTFEDITVFNWRTLHF